jgi:hypothetical protein
MKYKPHHRSVSLNIRGISQWPACSSVHIQLKLVRIELEGTERSAILFWHGHVKYLCGIKMNCFCDRNISHLGVPLFFLSSTANVEVLSNYFSRQIAIIFVLSVEKASLNELINELLHNELL